ncbi:MAG: CARDB domain-containing protein [Thermoplasmatota archaeon]
MSLLVALGFFVSVLAVLGAPAGAAGGRQPVFDASVEFYQANNATSSYDYKLGGPLTINLTIANTGDNAPNGNVTLSYKDAFFGTTDLKSWGPMELSNVNPTKLSYVWDSPMMAPDAGNNFTVMVSEGDVSINESFPITVKMGLPSITEVTLVTTNANPSMLVLGVDEMTINATIEVQGNQDMPGGRLEFWLDDRKEIIDQLDLPTIALGEERTFSTTTNLSGIAVSYGEHFITASVSSGGLIDEMVSANFTVVKPLADVQIVELVASPLELTIHTGESQNVTATVKLVNNGTAGAVDFPVHFYVDDAMTPADTVDINKTLAPAETLDVAWNWTVTDATPLGNHSIYVGVGSQSDWPYWAAVNVTVLGEAHLVIENMTLSPEADFEGNDVLVTVTVMNDGTDTAVNASVTLTVDGETIAEDNVTILRGATEQVLLTWTLPEVDEDRVVTIVATAGASEMSANVTIRNRAPLINITAFVLPQELRIGDMVEFRTTIKNEGSGDAVELLVEFYDNTTKLNSTTVNLTAGSTKDVVMLVNITGTGDVNHTFYVRALGAEANATKMVGHKLAAANIVISSFTVKPKTKEGQPKDSTQSYTLTITLKNTGEQTGSVVLNLTEGKKLLTPVPLTISIDGGQEVTKNITWKVKGDGKHTAVATLTGAAAGSPATKSVSCELHYTPGFEVVLLAAAIVVAAVLVRRRKR